jgi:hypothetical protein
VWLRNLIDYWGNIMSTKLGVRSAMMAALLAACGVSNTAFAIYEVEPNDSIATGQRLVIGDGGSVEVTAVLGTMDPAALPTYDVDFFWFQGTKNDAIAIDIDGGMKADGSSTSSVNTFLTLFRPDLTILAQNNQNSIDPGSVHFEDARIDGTPAVLPDDGIYYVAVSAVPVSFLDGGIPTRTDARSNGSYTLIISGVTPPPAVTYIGIEVKPGNRQKAAPFNPKSKGSLPVGLLSSPTFNPLEVDRQSIRFGASGDEDSLLRCHKEGVHLNADDIPDLICHFDTQAAKFGADDLSGFIKGKTPKGKFQGRGDLKVVPGAQ